MRLHLYEAAPFSFFLLFFFGQILLVVFVSGFLIVSVLINYKNKWAIET